MPENPSKPHRAARTRGWRPLPYLALAPRSGFPAITVPMGYVQGTLPVGLQFLGEEWDEARLIALAFAYEQATLHRRPPASTPPLRR